MDLITKYKARRILQQSKISDSNNTVLVLLEGQDGKFHLYNDRTSEKIFSSMDLSKAVARLDEEEEKCKDE